MHALNENGDASTARMETGIGCSWTAIAAIGLMLLIAGRAAAQAPGLGASVELVDPKVFRVCADPRNLPFSDEAARGSRTGWPSCSPANSGSLQATPISPR